MSSAPSPSSARRPDVAADADSDDHRRHHGEESRRRINATDSRGRAEVLPEPAGSQALHRRLRPRRPRDPRFGHGNSARSLVYADGILISNLLGNGATLHAALGPGDARGDRARRRALRAVLGGLSRQLRRRRGRLRDAHARRARDARERVELRPGFRDLRLATARYTGWQASASVGNRSGTGPGGSISIASTATRSRSAFANKLVSTGVPDTAGTPVTGALAEPQPAQPGLVDPWLDDGRRTRSRTTRSSRSPTTSRRRCAPATRSASWHNDAQRSFGVLSARRGAATRVQRARSTSTAARYAVTPTDFAPTAGDLRAPDARPLAADASARVTGTGRSPRASTTTTATIVRSPTVALPEAAAGGAGRIADQGGTGWSALALRGTAPPGQPMTAHILDFGVQRRRLSSCGRSCRTPTTGSRVRRRRASRRFAATPSSRACTRRTRWRSRRNGARRSACASSAGRPTNGAVANATATLGFAERTETYVSPEARARAPTDAATGAQGVARPRRAHADGRRELYQGSIASNVIVNNDPNLQAREIVDRRAHRRTRARQRQLAADLRSSRTRRTPSTRRPTSR